MEIAGRSTPLPQALRSCHVARLPTAGGRHGVLGQPQPALSTWSPVLGEQLPRALLPPVPLSPVSCRCLLLEGKRSGVRSPAAALSILPGVERCGQLSVLPAALSGASRGPAERGDRCWLGWGGCGKSGGYLLVLPTPSCSITGCVCFRVMKSIIMQPIFLDEASCLHIDSCAYKYCEFPHGFISLASNSTITTNLLDFQSSKNIFPGARCHSKIFPKNSKSYCSLSQHLQMYAPILQAVQRAE